MQHYRMEPDLEDALVAFMLTVEAEGWVSGTSVAALRGSGLLASFQALHAAYVAAPSKRPKKLRQPGARRPAATTQLMRLVS